MSHLARILLFTASTAALISAAHAETPTVTVGGIINAQAGYSDQDNAFEAGTRHQGFRNDTEVHINVEGKSDLGFAYGATIELEADVTADARSEGLNADKTFIWIEPAYGRFELGNNAGAEQEMVVNAASIARATGGIDGDDEFYITSSGSTGAATFLIHPDLPTADTGGIAEDATKITFYTPKFSGFQLGLSFTPDEGDGGQFATRSETSGDFENVLAAGLSYANEWDGISVAAALVGEAGDSESAFTEDLGAWQLGASISYSGFSLAGSYGDWNESGMAAGSSLDTDFWTLGGAYVWDAAGVSVTYFDSERGADDYESVVIGADYTLAAGLVPYAEVTFFDANEGASLTDNNGAVLLLGTYLNF